MRRLLTAALAATLLAGLLPLTVLAGTPQTITFVVAPADQTYGAGAVAISAHTDSGLQISFSSATGGVCSVAADPFTADPTTAKVTILHTGTCTIHADQIGDGTFDPAAQVPASFNIGPATQTVTADNKTITFGDADPTFTASFGAWQYSDSPAVVSGLTCGVTGAHASVSGSPYTIHCSGATANDYTFTTYTDGSLTINKANPQFSITAASSVYNGSAHAATGFAYGVGGIGDVLAPAVTFSYAGTSGTTYGPTATPPTQVGSYTVTASYAGDANYNAGSSPATPFSIVPGAQTLTFDLSSLHKTFGDPAFSVASYASASSGLPVSFASLTTSVCTTGGTNGATVTLVGAGTCTIRASQGGGGIFAPAADVDQSFSVTLAGTLQIQHVGAVAPTVIDVLADPLLAAGFAPGKPLSILPNVTQGTSGRVTTDGHKVTYDPNGCSTATDSFKFTATDGVSTLQVPVAVIVDKPGANSQPLTPVTDTPSVALTTGILGSAVPIRVGWCGVVATAVRSTSPYGLRQSSDAGVTFPLVYAGSAASTVRSITLAHSYAWQAETTDSSSRTGTSAATAQMSTLLVQDSQTSTVRYGGTWSVSKSIRFSGGSERYATRTTASASYTSVGARGFAIVTSKGIGRGSVKVYVDGKLVATVSERATSTLYKRIVYARALTYGSATKHTIKLVPSGNGRVDLDALVILR